MVTLDRILVENFKNIESASVDFGELNVIVGENGSGKSNFLMVLSFLRTILLGSPAAVEDLLRRGLSIKFGSLPPSRGMSDLDCRIALSFSDRKSSYKYAYEIRLGSIESFKFGIKYESFEFKKSSAKGTAVQFFTRNAGKIKFNNTLGSLLPLVDLKENYSVFKVLEIFEESLEHKFKDSISAIKSLLSTQTYYLSVSSLKSSALISEATKVIEDRVVNYDVEAALIKLSEDAEKWNYFNEIVRSVINLDRVEIRRANSDDEERKWLSYIYKGKNNILLELSDGMILVIGLLLKIFTCDHSVVFLEEPENSIHPKALQNLMGFLRSASDGHQFVITSHSATLLNFVRPEEVFVATMNSKGMTNISAVKNVKELKQKLSKDFMSFGEMIFETTSHNDEFEEIL